MSSRAAAGGPVEDGAVGGGPVGGGPLEGGAVEGGAARTRGDTGVVIAAAGSGARFGAKKQFLLLGGRPILHFSLDVLALLGDVVRVAVTFPLDDLAAGRRLVEAWREGLRSAGRTPPEVTPVAGGGRRQDSVVEGLRVLRDEAPFVLVHDAARPLVRAEDVLRVLDAIRRLGAAAIGTPVTDSMKRVKEGRIVESLPREEVWAVQTPQGAVLEILLDAYERAGDREMTDEASALALANVPVALVEGSRENLKITLPADVAAAERILAARAGRGG